MTPAHNSALHMLPHLSDYAQQGHVLNSLNTRSLISTRQLCDDYYAAIFSNYNLKIIKDGNIIINGQRNRTRGLLKIHLEPKPPPPAPTNKNQQKLACSAIQTKATKSDLAAFLHTNLFRPLPYTLIRSIKRVHLLIWPGLNKYLITKKLPKSTATSKDHLCSQHKNIKSTKITQALPLSTSLDISPIPEPINTCTH